MRHNHPVTNIAHIKQDGSVKAHCNTLPQTPTKLTRHGSIVVKIRCPASLKKSLREVANERDCFKGSVNALARDILRSRYHRPDIPEPNPNEPVTERLTLRLTPDELDALKCYAQAWRMPLWRALWNLAAKPYTVADCPQPTHVPHMAHSKEEVKRKNDLYVCPEGDTSKPSHRPVNGLAEKLWRVYGMALEVANGLVTRYDSDAILAAIELRERRNGTIYNPAGFILHLLKHGYAAKYAEAKRARQAPNLLAEKVKETVEGLGLPVAEIDGRPAIETPNGWLILPPDPEKAKEFALRFALPVKTDQPAKDAPDAVTDDQNGQPDSEPDAISDSEPDAISDSEPTESEPIDPEPNPFELYPFAAPRKLPPSMPRSRAERAAEIAAFDQPLQPLGEPQRAYRRCCPRCGHESKDLQLKRFEPTYKQLNDAELERWDGVEVCFGEPASCFDALKRHEVIALKRHCGILDDLPEPQLPTPTKLPSSFAVTAQSPPSLTFTAKEPPTPTNEPDNQSNETPNLTDFGSHDCELVRCPRCGRLVSRRRMNRTGDSCLDCVLLELKQRRQRVFNEKVIENAANP